MQTEKEEQHPELGNLQEEFDQADGETPLPEGYKEEMLKAILAKTQRTKRGKMIRLTGVLSAAAAVVLLVGVGWLLRERRDGRQTRVTEGNRIAMRARWLTRSNDETRQETWTMPDGSTVILYPSSKIQYREDFGHYNKREVRVSGEAFFEVVKNPTAPFMVYADGIRTEVLGTAFKVINDSVTDKIRVQLFTGKVRVSVPDSDYTLQPGQELTWEKGDRRVWVTNFNRKNGRSKLLDGNEGTLANWYMFNNQSLGTVFDQLAAIYGADIQYDDRSVNNMYFIGMLDRKDSLDKILNDLAVLNHLSVTRRGGKYSITGIRH